MTEERMSIYRVTFPDGVKLHLEADDRSDADLRVGRVFRGERFTIELEAAEQAEGSPAGDEECILRSVPFREPQWLC